jgi:glycosyltransferase involved in cell wall biosynthesis
MPTENAADRSLRIGIIALESYPVVHGSWAGGITQYVSAMARGYVALGHDVHIFALGPRGDVSWDGATVHYAARRLGRVTGLPLNEVDMARVVRHERRRGAFDVLEVIDGHVPALLSTLMSRDSRVIYKLHGTTRFVAALNGQSLSPKQRAADWRERRLALRADLLCSADGELAKAMASAWQLREVPPTLPDPVIAPLAISRAKRDESGPLRVLSVGRLERRKGQLTLIRALNRLSEVADRLDVTFVGGDTATGPAGSSYKALMVAETAAAVRHRITYMDAVPRESLWDMYAESDVAVIGTVDGNYGYATMDALAAGMAVVTTTPNGDTESPYVRHQDTALVYRSEDDSELADRMLQILNRPREADRLGLRARKDVLGRLSPQVIAADVLRRVMDSDTRASARQNGAGSSR